MGGNHPERPHHPFGNPEQHKKLHDNATEAWIVWNRVSIFWRENQGHVIAQDVIDLFNDPKMKRELWPNCKLHDVWLRASWEADDEMWGGPAEIPNEKVARHAELDQIAALIEEAMDLAGHRPADMPKEEFPK